MSRDNPLESGSFQYTVRGHVLKLKALWFGLSTNQQSQREQEGVCTRHSVTLSKVINLEVVFGLWYFLR